jgi:hypothetical protein
MAQLFNLLKGQIVMPIGVALSDETTALTTGAGKAVIHVPRAYTISSVYAELRTAASTGVTTFDINVGAGAGATILSTKLTIDATEETSATAATPAVVSNSALAVNSRVTFDIDAVGTGAAGAKVWLMVTNT